MKKPWMKIIISTIGTVVVLMISVLFYSYRTFKLKSEGAVDNTHSFPTELTYHTSQSGHIIVHVLINNKRLPFILDSGASNMIFEEYKSAFDFGACKGPSFGIGSGKGFFITQMYKLDSINIEDIKFNNLTFEVNKKILFDCQPEIAGIIGKETMRHLMWQFRPNEKKIIIAKNSTELNIPSSAQKIRLTKNKMSHHLYTSVKIDEHKLDKFIVDTGSNGMFDFSTDSTFITRYSSEILGVFGSNKIGLGGKLINDFNLFFTNKIVLGGHYKIQDTVACAISSSSLNTLGLGFLNQYNYTLDWHQNLLTLEALSNQDFVYSAFGISTRYNEKTKSVEIRGIIENSQPFKMGLNPGMKIISLNGISMKSKEDYCTYYNNQKESDTLHIQLENKGQITKYTFTRENYLNYLNN